MGITKSNLNGMDWDNELLYIQTSRIETLKSTISILQDTIKSKDERIEMLQGEIERILAWKKGI